MALINHHRIAANELTVCVHIKGRERALNTLDVTALSFSNILLTDRGAVGQVVTLLLK